MRISERVDVEVTEGVAVFVLRADELILALLDTVPDAEEVFDTDDDELTVPVLRTVLDITGLRDTLIVPVDVLLGRVVRVIVVELEEVFDSLAEADSVTERIDDHDGRADNVIVEDRELQAVLVIKVLAEGLNVIV